MAVAFDDVLEQTLGELGEEPTRTWAMPPAGTAAAYGFFFDAVPQTPFVQPCGYADVAAFTAPHIPADACTKADHLSRGCTGSQARLDDGIDPQVRISAGRAPDAGTPSSSHVRAAQRPTRRLSAIERIALAEMNELGAELDECFTADQLRSAFRRLARRYHPDRHAGSTADEQASLSIVFVRLRDAYSLLARA